MADGGPASGAGREAHRHRPAHLLPTQANAERQAELDLALVDPTNHVAKRLTAWEIHQVTSTHSCERQARLADQ